MANGENISKCNCPNCGGYIEFPAEAEGQTMECPHCQAPVELQAAMLEHRSPALPYTIAAIFFLLVAIGAAFLARKYQSETPPPASGQTTVSTNVDSQKPQENTPAPAQGVHDLKPGKVTLQNTKESSLVYAVGTIKNTSAQQKFGLKVAVAIFDKDGNEIGTASDYKTVLEPHDAWTFRALVTESNAANARITQITEQ